MRQINWIEQYNIMEDISIKDIKKVIDTIFVSTGIDFGNYAFSSFKRRIIRFFEINKVRDLNSFLERVLTDRNYADTLVREITVNVTEMFRDPSFWKVLRDKILPEISDRKTINIWHAACSTGEEVYSMLILLKEAGLLDKSRIIATDLNSNVLKVAERGIYSLRNLETNIKNYIQFGGSCELSDYYSVVDNTIHFNLHLADNVEFRCHNLAQEGPISGFDLILCRNVLIYFNFELQEKVINTFNESMDEGSFLAIGSKESIRWCKASTHFTEESYDEKIYRKVVKKKPHLQVTF